MKRLLISHIFVTIVMIVIMGFSSVTPAQGKANKPYVEVTLKSGEAMRLEYRSFLEENLPILPERTPDSSPEVIGFGERRVTFVEKDTCEKHDISLDNLQELEILGIAFNPCSNKKDWLLKLYLLDLDKYVGFFQTGKANSGAVLSEHELKGQRLGQSNTVSLRFEDIQKITFSPR